VFPAGAVPDDLDPDRSLTAPSVARDL